MKKLIILILLLIFPLNCFSLELEIDSLSAVLYNRDTNEVLYSKNPDNVTKIASITKIMTVLVSLENIKSFDEEITITNNDIKDIEDYTKLNLKVGDTLTYNDLLYSTIMVSAADSALALSNNVFNDYNKFIDKMNELAHKLNMINTHFSNPIGKDNDNYSTANDIKTLLNYALDNKKFYDIYTKDEYYIKSIDKTINNNVNKSIIKNNIENKNNIELIGSKSGFTTPSGMSLSSLSKLNNNELILITLNAMDDVKSLPNIKDQMNILNYFYDNYSNKLILEKNKLIDNIKYNKNIDYEIRSNKELYYYLNNDIDLNYLKIYYDGIVDIKKNTKENTLLGNIYVYLNDTLLGKEEVYFNKDNIVKKPIDYKRVIIVLCILIFSILIMFITRKKHKKRKNKK